MSSSFVATPLGNFPKQLNFKVAGIFNTGFLEFDQNIIFVNIEDALAIFDKENKDQNVEIYLERAAKSKLIQKKNSKN